MFEVKSIDDEGCKAVRTYTEYKALLLMVVFVLGFGSWLISIIEQMLWMPPAAAVVVVLLLVAAAKHGMPNTTYQFDHDSAQLTILKKEYEETVFSYSQVKLRKEFLATGSMGIQTVDYVVDVPGVLKDFTMPISVDNQERFEDFLATFEIRRAEVSEQQDAQLLLEEKASGQHLLVMPEGATSNAGTPVAVPASLGTPKE